MLAWIFWHARQSCADPTAYRTAVERLHRTLAEARLSGHHATRSLRYSAMPWLEPGVEIYEDWYFLESSTALDSLDASISEEPLHGAHLEVVRLAECGVGGLYRLRAGTALKDPAFCTWIAKPRHVSYEQFIGAASRAGTVWSRQMVLGPTPEFCIESDRPLSDDLRNYVVYELRPEY